MLQEVNILLGVTGGVAAYKAVDLASKLTAAGAGVRTVMTEAACRLVGPKSFEAVTGSPVYTAMWSAPDESRISHIELADWADLIVVAPATANVLGKGYERPIVLMNCGAMYSASFSEGLCQEVQAIDAV